MPGQGTFICSYPRERRRRTRTRQRTTFSSSANALKSVHIATAVMFCMLTTPRLLPQRERARAPSAAMNPPQVTGVDTTWQGGSFAIEFRFKPTHALSHLAGGRARISRDLYRVCVLLVLSCIYHEIKNNMQHWQQRAAAATTSTLLTDMIKCCLGLLFCLLLSHSVSKSLPLFLCLCLTLYLSLALSLSLLVCLHCHVLQCSTPDRPLVPYQMKVYKLMLPSFLAAWLGLFPAAAQELQRFASCTNNLQAGQVGGTNT